MKTPFQVLKEIGTPDAVVAFLSAFLLVLCISPWLGISIGSVTLTGKVPWIVSPVAALIFVLLFVPCIPVKTTASPAEKELRHRFDWIRRHLLVDDLTVDSAQEAEGALNGWGGAFHSAEDQFQDKHIEPILRDAKWFQRWRTQVDLLRSLFKQLPTSWSPNDMVEPGLASQLKETVGQLNLPPET